MTRRRLVLGGVLVGLVLVAAALLVEVLATAFFAVTVAYLLLPLKRRLKARGVSDRLASVAATLAGFLGTVLVLSPLVVVLVLRFDSLVTLASLLPNVVSIELFGATYTATLAELEAVAIATLRALAQRVAVAAPVLLIKLTLFGFLVYGLLYHERATHRALLAVVPPDYREEARALATRARETLFAIYVLQAATAVGTFVLALPVFVGLGYDTPIALATVSAVLQFVPIVGPSFLLAGLAVFHVFVGETVRAVLVVVVGGFFVAWLPDVLIRPRLAMETASLPGTLYFVGFVGGLLTLGAVGIIAGPLIVALVVESATLLSDELNVVPVQDG